MQTCMYPNRGPNRDLDPPPSDPPPSSPSPIVTVNTLDIDIIAGGSCYTAVGCHSAMGYSEHESRKRQGATVAAFLVSSIRDSWYLCTWVQFTLEYQMGITRPGALARE